MSGRRVAWALFGAAQALVLASLVLLVAGWNAPIPDSWGFRSFTVIPAVVFSWTGMAIVAYRRNLVGWILLVTGGLSAAQEFASEYAIYGVLARPGSLLRPDLGAWIESWIWVSFLALAAVYVPLVFPNGRLLSPRWWVLAVATGVVVATMSFGLAFSAGPLNNAPFVENPFGLVRFFELTPSGTQATANSGFYAVYAAFFACAVAAAASVVVRYRRARGVERQQIKWLAYGTAVVAVAVIVGGFFQEHKAGQYFLIAALHVIPLSVGVAVLRYRLYDIDLLINRTLVYGSLSAALAATYVLLVVIAQSALRPLTGGSEIAVAASTLATLALVQPLRRRIQGAVDRRFYRSRYDAARTLDAFTTHLRDEVDLDALRGDLLDVIGNTVSPAHAGVWLRGAGR